MISSHNYKILLFWTVHINIQIQSLVVKVVIDMAAATPSTDVDFKLYADPLSPPTPLPPSGPSVVSEGKKL